MDKLAFHREIERKLMPDFTPPPLDCTFAQVRTGDDFTLYTKLIHLGYSGKGFPKLNSAVEYLQMYSSRIVKVPTTVGQLQNLCYLGLSQTTLQTLPSEIGELKNLVSLDLSYNPIAKLPKEFCKLNLIELQVQQTKLVDLDHVNNLAIRVLNIAGTSIVLLWNNVFKELTSTSSLAARVYQHNQNGLLKHTAALPLEAINTEQLICQVNSSYMQSWLHWRRPKENYYNFLNPLK